MIKRRNSLSVTQVIVIAMMIGGVAIILSRFLSASDGVETVDVNVPPQLSSLARSGKVLFDANCAECHGEVGGGTDRGPPLVHDIYNPGHHADVSFLLAAQNGVRAHHWPFGNMPPQAQMNEAQVEAIVKYVRELQQANGITYRPHRM
jgi:mono/diheme cytochrome c family protein